MKRRALLAAAAVAALAPFGSALATPGLIRTEPDRVLRFIPQADVTGLDPVWTSVYVTRNHAYLVFDTLYGQDSSYAIRPQMIEGHTVEQDGRLWRLRLREGLMFTTARPCWRAIVSRASGAGRGATHSAKH
jgi:peptide/nickel transport system substrate-binding protein